LESHGLVYRLFSVYRGEGKKAALFCLLTFLTALSIVCGVTLSDGLFLEQIGGGGIPLVFLLTAIGMLSGSALYFYSLHRFSIGQIALGLCALMASFYTSMLCLPQVGPLFWYLLKAGCYIFLTVMWTALWTFIDQYYDLQDAKRLYGLFTACLVTGCAAGSGLVYLIVSSLSLSGMLLVALGSVCAVAAAILVISKTQELVPDDTLGDAAPRAEGRSIVRVMRQILTSRFTLLLLLSSFLVEVLTAFTEFKYMDRLSTIFVSDHHLTLFLAKCRTAIYICNVVIGLFFYGRAVKRFGTSTLLMVPSLYFTFLFAVWPFDGGVLPAVLGLVAIEGVLYAIDDPNFNLLINAVPPKIKARVRVLIESFFEPLGLLISSVFLLCYQGNAIFIGLGVALLAVFVCTRLYRHYSPALFANLSVNSVHFEREPSQWLGKEDRETALTALSSDDLREVEIACHALIEIATLELLPYLLAALERLGARSQEAVLEKIARSDFADEPLVIDHLRRWGKGPALLYLAKMGHLDAEGAKEHLNSEWLRERASALIALGRSDLCQAMLGSDNPEEVAIALGHLPIDRELILPFLNHPSLLIERAAMGALAKVATAKEAAVCIEKLETSGDAEVRMSALRAIEAIGESDLAEPLVKASSHFRPAERRAVERILCGMGARVVPTLIALVRDRTLHDRCRLLAGRAAGRLALPQLQLHLEDLVTDESERAFLLFYHQATIQERYPHRDLRLAVDRLLGDYHQVIDFVVQMVGLCASLDKVELLSHSLRSHNEKIHSQAVEMLADSCDRSLFRKLEPLIDDRPLGDKLAHYLEGGGQIYSLEELGLEAEPKRRRSGPLASPLALELARA